MSNVKTIDEVTEDHCRRLLSVTKWRANMVVSVRTWPLLNVFHDLPKDQTNNRCCSACDKPKVILKYLWPGSDLVPKLGKSPVFNVNSKFLLSLTQS